MVSQPDRPSGRGRKLTPPAVAAHANEAGLPLFQPETLRSEDAVRRLEAANPDLLVVVAYGEILRKSVLQLAPGGALNVHPSLLPRYRGASPIAEAIRNGDSQTGVSIIKLVRRLDAGPVVAQATVDLHGTETTGSLSQRLANLAAEMLPDVCDAWIAGALEPIEQDESAATYTHEWSKRDAEIDWNQSAEVIERLIRAAIPWPVAWTSFDVQRLQIRSARVVAGQAGAPGEITSTGNRVLVATGRDSLELLSVQPEGKREMPASGWWTRTCRFHRVSV